MYESAVFISVFTAGILSFASPCVLPLLPVYGAVLTGGEYRSDNGKWRVLFNSVCFLGGFTTVFMLMGASASYLGQVFFDNQPLLRKIGSVFIILMGLYMLGVLELPLFSREYRPLMGRVFQGPAGSFVLGVAFTAGWTPCIGPVLAGVLAYAGSLDTLRQGAALLFVYALGFCLPFLALAVTTDKWLPKYQKFFVYLPQIQRVFGVLLIIAGVLIYFDLVTRLIGFLWNYFL
jgi:cytochrome c-type biogenesis protein